MLKKIRWKENNSMQSVPDVTRKQQHFIIVCVDCCTFYLFSMRLINREWRVGRLFTICVYYLQSHTCRNYLTWRKRKEIALDSLQISFLSLYCADCIFKSIDQKLEKITKSIGIVCCLLLCFFKTHGNILLSCLHFQTPQTISEKSNNNNRNKKE